MQYLCLIFPLFILLFGLLIAAIPTFFAVRYRRRTALITGLPFSKVQDLATGVAKIKARVAVREELLYSPLGRRECVYFHFQVDEMHRSGGRHGGNYWVAVVNDTQSVDVVLKDQTGEANIDLRQAEVVLKSSESQNSGMFNDPPERLRNVLERRYGRSTKGWFFNKTLRYSETTLADGAKVVVVGEVAVGRNGVPVFRKGKTPLIVSDKDDKQLGTHYFGRELLCWGGAAVILLLATIGTGVAEYMVISAISGGAPVVAGGPPTVANPPQVGGPQPPPGPDAREAEINHWLADMRDHNTAKHRHAAEQLGRTPVIEARRAEVKRELETLLEYGDAQVKGGALKGLETWGDAGTLPLLLRYAEQRDFPKRKELLEALRKFPDERTGFALAAALADPNDRGTPADALRVLGPTGEKGVLLQLQTSKDPDVQAEACNVLREIGGQASIPALKAAKASPNPKVSRAAADALLFVGGLNDVHDAPR